MSECEIDAVVTWVDGADPAHAAKRRLALETEQFDIVESIPAGRDQTRFSDNGELWYCLNGLRKFAPWIRTIHLVTDRQCPSFLTERYRELLGVQLVDHLDIFAGYEWALPTFNSITIETALHRIPGLASRYLYLNDDFIIVRPVDPEDFFLDDKVVLRGEWRSLNDFSRPRLAFSAFLNLVFKKVLGVNRSMSLLQQMRAARLAGMSTRYYRSPHVPHPIRKDVLKDFFDANPEAFQENIRHKFRHASQFVATFLANHLEINRNSAACVPADDSLMICFNRDSTGSVERKVGWLQSEKIRFFCLQSFEQASPLQRQLITDYLGALLSLDDVSPPIAELIEGPCSVRPRHE